MGISSEQSVTRKLLSRDAGIVVLVDRPGEYAVRKYYDENDPSESPATEPEDEQSPEAGGGEDQSGDVNMDSEGVQSGKGLTNPADELAKSMKVLRLKGR